MWAIKCSLIKLTTLKNTVLREILENYLIVFEEKLNLEQHNKLIGSVLKTKNVAILCDSYNQAEYLYGILNKANIGKCWEFKIVSLDANNSEF